MHRSDTQVEQLIGACVTYTGAENAQAEVVKVVCIKRTGLLTYL